MGIFLGLTAALSWGLADYFAAVASRRAGSFRVVLGFHLVAVALLALLVFGTGETLADVGGEDLAWFLLLGFLGALSYLCFYRALAIGPISIVSPIVSAYAAATVVCAARSSTRPSPAIRSDQPNCSRPLVKTVPRRVLARTSR